MLLRKKEYVNQLLLKKFNARVIIDIVDMIDDHYLLALDESSGLLYKIDSKGDIYLLDNLQELKLPTGNEFEGTWSFITNYKTIVGESIDYEDRNTFV